MKRKKNHWIALGLKIDSIYIFSRSTDVSRCRRRFSSCHWRKRFRVHSPNKLTVDIVERKKKGRIVYKMSIIMSQCRLHKQLVHVVISLSLLSSQVLRILELNLRVGGFGFFLFMHISVEGAFTIQRYSV